MRRTWAVSKDRDCKVFRSLKLSFSGRRINSTFTYRRTIKFHLLFVLILLLLFFSLAQFTIIALLYVSSAMMQPS